MARKKKTGHSKALHRKTKARKPKKSPITARHASLYYPKPDDMRDRVRMEPPKIPQPSSPIDIRPVPSLSRIDEPRKKPRHDAMVSVGGGAALSACIALFFYYVIGLDVVFSLALALPFFIGLSILFYNFLELSERVSG